VRVITRLDETCREVRDAARVIGDADLFTKMEEAQALIKRDSELFRFEPRGKADTPVVFAASLVGLTGSFHKPRAQLTCSIFKSSHIPSNAFIASKPCILLVDL